MRRAFALLGLWLTLGFVLLPLAGRTEGLASTDPAAVLPPTAESTRALIREREAFPGADTPVAVVLYARDSGITAADRSAVEADRAAFAAFAESHAVDPAAASPDGQALLLAFPVKDKALVQRIQDRLAGAPAGLRTAVTGSAGALADIDEVGRGVDTTLFLAAGAIVAVLLLLTYRSPVLWIFPLLCAGLASRFTTGVIYLLVKGFGLTFTPDATTMMTVLVFGASTDYALLLIARYREELHHHADRRDAMRLALRRSLPAVLASAATVTLGVLCLVFAQMNDMRSFGPIAAAGIVVSVAVMTTLLPALLILAGRWVFWPFVPTVGKPATRPGARTGWQRVAAFVDRRPRLLWIASTLVLLALSSGVLHLQLGQSTSQMYTSQVSSVTGQQLVVAHFPAGSSAPAVVLAESSTVDAVVAAARAVPGVASTLPVTRSADGRWVRVEAVLADPPDSPAAGVTLDRLRAATRAVPGADALVGGPTATNVDVGRASLRDDEVVLPLILLVVLLVLVVLLRAVVAPLLLVASVALSYAAAMGLCGYIFAALGHQHIMQGLPLYGWLFLVTLGVDYTIFLMTRAKEEVARRGHRRGVLTALAVTGGVITSAGLVLAGTFGVLVIMPFVSAIQMGLIVAVGVLLDTFVVRTLLVPALSIDVGPRLWWPAGPAPDPRAPQPLPSPTGVAA